LVESELLAFLQCDAYLADLITATDVLIYVGELDALFARIPSHLNPAGIFAFSTESPVDLIDDFRLELTGRYSHHARYIERLATSNGLEIIKKIDTVIRTEMAMPLLGHVFMLKKI
jgi:predicted TPR repeat methyltransferase